MVHRKAQSTLDAPPPSGSGIGRKIGPEQLEKIYQTLLMAPPTLGSGIGAEAPGLVNRKKTKKDSETDQNFGQSLHLTLDLVLKRRLHSDAEPSPPPAA